MVPTVRSDTSNNTLVMIRFMFVSFMLWVCNINLLQGTESAKNAFAPKSLKDLLPGEKGKNHASYFSTDAKI